MSEIIYLDNSATTYPKPEIVYNYMNNYYKKYGFNINRSNLTGINDDCDLIHENRDLMIKMFSASKYDVIFNNTATEALNLMIKGYSWKVGEVVYITPFEHNAVLRPLYEMEKKFKLKIIELSVTENLNYDLEAIKIQFFSEKPNLIIMSHASNVCGLITPIEEIINISKSFKAKVYLDISQSAGVLDLNLDKLDIECVAFTGHKSLYSAFGVGGVFIKKNFYLTPLIHGGTGINSSDKKMPKIAPYRYEAGSMNIVAQASLNASLKWINKNKNLIFEQKRQLFRYINSILSEFDEIVLYLNENLNKHISVLSFNVDNYSSENVSNYLSKRKIIVRSGLQCSPLSHKLLKTYPEGTVRLSLSFFNTKDQIDKFINILEEMI